MILLEDRDGSAALPYQSLHSLNPFRVVSPDSRFVKPFTLVLPRMAMCRRQSHGRIFDGFCLFVGLIVDSRERAVYFDRHTHWFFFISMVHARCFQPESGVIVMGFAEQGRAQRRQESQLER